MIEMTLGFIKSLKNIYVLCCTIRRSAHPKAAVFLLLWLNLPGSLSAAQPPPGEALRLRLGLIEGL